MDNSTTSNKISIDPTSLVSLKAELLRKQEEFRQKKLAKSSSDFSNDLNDEYKTAKTETTWGKKKKVEWSKKEEENSLIEETNDGQVLETEQMLFERSKKMLESKAQYYDEVMKGKKRTEEGDEEIFLVDFDTKVSEETKTQREGLKLKQEINEEDYNETMKVKWDKESLENLEKVSLHYQDIKYNEIRNMGVGNFQFSRDEEERQKQMEFFKNIEKEIKSNRITNEIYKLKREKIMLERLNKLKQKRLRRLGYLEDQIKEMCKYDNDIEEIEQELKILEHQAQNPELYSKKIDQEEDETNKPVKRVILDREWDKPKLKEKMWEKHVEKLRNERNRLYAPPKFYETQSNKKKKSKNKNFQKNQYSAVPPPT